jgi:hypothetical protein
MGSLMQETATEIYLPPAVPEISGSSDIDIGNSPENETVLTSQILQLWEIYRTCKNTAKDENQRLRATRQNLGPLTVPNEASARQTWPEWGMEFVVKGERDPPRHRRQIGPKV